MLDHEGKEVPGNRGYKYFGAAKDLPGVRELFEKERELNVLNIQKRKAFTSLSSVCDVSLIISFPAVAPPRKTRGELMKDIDAEYYGYRDEDDGVLVPLEQEYEKQGRTCYSPTSFRCNALQRICSLMI